LVKCLAIFAHEEDAVNVKKEHYGVDQELYNCILLWDRESQRYYGMAFFCFGYDLAQGQFLFLEDLYIEEEYRGKGQGTIVMAALASIARGVGCTGFIWQCLEWNARALTFYDGIGAKMLNGLITTRFCDQHLENFVASRPAHL
jgi:GNAT superfamily N-acetyltransferase